MGNSPHHRSAPTIPATRTISDSRILGRKLSSFADNDTVLWLDNSGQISCRDLFGFELGTIALPDRFRRDKLWRAQDYQAPGLAVRISGPPTIYYFIANARLHRIYFTEIDKVIEPFNCGIEIDAKFKIFRNNGLFFMTSGRNKYEISWEVYILDNEWNLLKTLDLPNTCYREVGFTDHEIIFICLEGLSYYNITTGTVTIRPLNKAVQSYRRNYQIIDQIGFGASLNTEMKIDDAVIVRKSVVEKQIIEEDLIYGDFCGALAAGPVTSREYRSEMADSDSINHDAILMLSGISLLSSSITTVSTDTDQSSSFDIVRASQSDSRDRINSRPAIDLRALSVDQVTVVSSARSSIGGSTVSARRASREIIRNPGYLVSLLKNLTGDQTLVVVDRLDTGHRDVLVSTLDGDPEIHSIALSNNKTLYMYSDSQIITWKPH